MKKMYSSRLLHTGGLLLGLLVWLANSGNPPNGLTGAPFDNGTCNNCHSGGSYSGTVSIGGLPSTIEPNTTYPMEITLTATSGSPVRAGYQLVVVDGNNNNAGDLMTVNGQSGTEFFNGREYIEHRGAKNFSGNTVNWAFSWKSPVSAAGNTIKFYFIGNFCNGNGSTGGDVAFAFSETYSFAGAPPLTVSITNVTPVSCFGGNNGSATAEPSGGTPPYTYAWSNGQNTQTAVNLSAGTYTVTVTGSAGSGTATASVTITQPPNITLSASSSGIITCANPTVTLTATATGGVPPFSFSWSNGAQGNPIEVSTPGTYTVTATDANGCTKTAPVSVAANITPPVANAGPSVTLTCSQPLATLNGAGSSTGPNFSYLWTASNGGNIVSGQTTLNPVVNAAGTYTLVVTNNQNGCTGSASTTATSNQQPPTAVATGGTVTCADTNVTVQVTTNANNATFSWTGPGGFSSNQSSFSTSVPGTYSVTVTNTANGCSATASATVAVNNTIPSIQVNGGVLTCSDTVVQLIATTNAANPTFNWSGPAGFSSTQPGPTVSMPGIYHVTVTNTQNGCTATASASVLEDRVPPPISIATDTLTCADTLAQIVVATPSDSFAFSWVGPAGFSAQERNLEVTLPGVYTVTATFLPNGCTTVDSTAVPIDTAAPTVAIAPPFTLNCAGDTLLLDGSASSQGPHFAYLWTTADGNIVSGDTTLTPIVDAAGTYTLTVANLNNGCTSADSVGVVQSPPVAEVTEIVAVSCFGLSDGSAAVSAGGGAGGFTFLWSTGDTTAVVEGLVAGTYFVTVTDIENCTATAAAEVPEPPLLEANASATGETAFGANDGTATAQPIGGTQPYIYSWSTGDTTATLSDLAPGPYTVTVEDANGCTVVQTVTVNAFSCFLSAVIAVTHVSCSGADDGTATVVINQGEPPLSYLWSQGDTTATIANLPPGIYTVSVTDGNNCPLVLSATIISPTSLQPNVTATPETGVNRNDGTATAAPVGGVAPYTFLWNTGDTAATLTGLSPGIYTVTVTDANGCTAAQSAPVNAFNCQLSLSLSTADVRCHGLAEGAIFTTVAQGTPPYAFTWSNGASTPNITNIGAGTYTVTVSDAAGCQATSSATVTQPLPIQATLAVTPASCPESKDGRVKITAISGGTPPYSYSFSSGTPDNLGVGSYSLTIVDSQGCLYKANFTVTSNDTLAPTLTCPPNRDGCWNEPVVYELPTAADNCALGNARPVLLEGLPSGSTFPQGQTLQVFEIRDASGNKAVCSFTVTVGPPISVNLDTVVNDVGGAGSGRIEVSISGGVGALTFRWTRDGQPFAQTEDLANLRAGTYLLVVTDEKGCSRTFGPVVVDNVISTFAPAETVRLRVVPNPALSTVRLEMEGNQPALVYLVDAQGRIVQQLEPTDIGRPIFIADLAAGRYYFKVTDRSGQSRLVSWIKQ